MVELRQASFVGSPQTYLYLEVGGTLLSFCYAANALVRFRGTHDRTALILAFGFVLSGIIETVGYFGLNEARHHRSCKSCIAFPRAGWSAAHCWPFCCWRHSCGALHAHRSAA